MQAIGERKFPGVGFDQLPYDRPRAVDACTRKDTLEQWVIAKIESSSRKGVRNE